MKKITTTKQSITGPAALRRYPACVAFNKKPREEHIMEYWDVLDVHGNKTGRRVRRQAINHFPPGDYHLAVHIWLIAPGGNYLIQKRSHHRQLMPGEWAATGGSALSGESSQTAALRELHEELGILLRPEHLQYLTRYVRRSTLLDVWWARVDSRIDPPLIQTEEVAAVKWVNGDELKNMIANRSFHNYGVDYFERIFALIV